MPAPSSKHGLALGSKSIKTTGDTLTLGKGSDTVYLTQGTYSPSTAPITITDFSGQSDQGDKIDVSHFPGTFSFVGTAAFNGESTQKQIRYEVSGSDILVYVDLDGDGTEEMMVKLLNTTTALTSSDFNL